MSSAKESSQWIDGALYPDTEVPASLESLTEQIDFVARLCSAWDFGRLPMPETLNELLQPRWKQAVEETMLLTSCAYHLLRELHRLAPVAYLGPRFPEILNDLCLQYV